MRPLLFSGGSIMQAASGFGKIVCLMRTRKPRTANLDAVCLDVYDRLRGRFDVRRLHPPSLLLMLPAVGGP